MGAANSTQNYTYQSSTWGDFVATTSTPNYPFYTYYYYDSNGRLVADDIWEYYWENGTQLTEMVQYDAVTDAYNWTFKYDANGMRTSRRGYNIYLYTYEDGKLIHMDSGSGDMDFFYGANGLPTALKFDGTYYYYVTNALGDVVALLNSSGEEVVRYVYDAWGNILSITGSESMRVGEINPLRYRSYVYDREIGLYYLNSRYYNPKIGRFISADNPNYLGADGTPASYNLFAYCGNNPVNYVDRQGSNPYAVATWTNTMWWLCLVDTLLPVGDIIYVAGILVLGIYALSEAADIKSLSAEREEEKAVAIATTKKPDDSVIFPVNPNDFNPLGLVKVHRTGTNNGAFISWMDPLTNTEVFRWDENPNYPNGPHYHINNPIYRKAKVHFYPGDVVPEPYATIYFPFG